MMKIIQLKFPFTEKLKAYSKPRVSKINTKNRKIKK